MRFAIYIPGDDIPDESKLVAVGLPHLIRNASGMGTNAGPDGQPGIVFSWQDPRNPRSVMGYQPNNQQWIPAAERDGRAHGRFWIGFTNNSPLTPEDCVTGQFRGYPVVLGDGREWIIPAAAHLPQDIEIGDHGVPIYHIQERFAKLAIESQEWTNWLKSLEEGLESIRISDTVVDYLCQMLQLNYGWLIPDVIEHLGLFKPNPVFRALLAATTGMIASESEGAVA